jgi:hypothetical protein
MSDPVFHDRISDGITHSVDRSLDALFASVESQQ